MDAHQDKTKTDHEELMAMKASQEAMETLMDVSIGTTKACPEEIETDQENV
jgi:hypothetical protein